MSESQVNTFAVRSGVGVSLSATNAALGNFAGGNAANRGSVSVLFLLKQL